MRSKLRTGEQDALLIVDMQNDFCSGGALAVAGADDVFPAVNELAALFQNVILTQDWHPRGHISFASSHPGRQAFETIEVAYGDQTLWPDHCVQATRGADFHPRLQAPHAALVLRKGFWPDIDSYSAFLENDRKTSTGLAGYLRDRGLKRIFLAGLALDFCVRFSAEDAVALGFDIVVVEDACRAIDTGDSLVETRASLYARNIPCVSSVTIERI